MRPEVERLEKELRQLATSVAPTIAERLNKFHNYVVDYWMNLMGPTNLSVAGALHKTNNVIERYIYNWLLYSFVGNNYLLVV
jgi:hypothetical protein